MFSRRITGLLVAAAVIISAVYWWRIHPGRSAGTAGSGEQTVGVVPAQLRDVPVRVDASGAVVSLNSVDIRAQVASTVREVLIKDGQTMQKGQLLFRFDARGDQANLDKARAQLARDRATLADLERQYQRAVDLRAQNFIAQSALDTVQSQVEAQRALLVSDEAALQSAQVNLSYDVIRSPLNGRAGAVNVQVGSLVVPNATGAALVNIAQMNPIGVSFTLPETQLAALLQALNQKDKAPLEAQIVLPGTSQGGARATEAPLKGKVVFVDNNVDAATGSIRVKAEFDNTAGKLWPGQYVSMRLILRNIPNALVVPQAALILRGTERSVYVVNEDKTVQLVPVQVRYPFGEMVAVDGLQAGDKVVVDGKQNLRPGSKVRDVPATLEPAGGARRAGAASATPQADAGESR